MKQNKNKPNQLSNPYVITLCEPLGIK